MIAHLQVDAAHTNKIVVYLTMDLAYETGSKCFLLLSTSRWFINVVKLSTSVNFGSVSVTTAGN
jgi:hypothetical protein